MKTNKELLKIWEDTFDHWNAKHDDGTELVPWNPYDWSQMVACIGSLLEQKDKEHRQRMISLLEEMPPAMCLHVKSWRQEQINKLKQ